jgi:hypothetical protein
MVVKEGIVEMGLDAGDGNDRMREPGRGCERGDGRDKTRRWNRMWTGRTG